MRVSIDLDTLVVTPSVAPIQLKRRAVIPIDVIFVRQGVAVELGSSASGNLGIKATLADTTFLADAFGWTKSGSGSSAVYSFLLDLAQTTLETAFSSNPPSISAFLEFAWVDGSYQPASQTQGVTISNCLINGAEDPYSPALELDSDGNLTPIP